MHPTHHTERAAYHIGAGLAAGQGRQSRQLLHLEAMDSIDTADTAESADMLDSADMYPRDNGAVHKYLADALKGNSGPHEVPVWFVVVSDPK